MGIFDNSNLVDLVTKYFKTHLELLKLDIQEHFEKFLSKILRFILIAFFIGVTILFLLLGLANFLNNYFGNSFAGHLCVSGIALVTSLIILCALNKKTYESPLVDLKEDDDFINAKKTDHD